MPRDKGSPFRWVIRWIFDPLLPRELLRDPAVDVPALASGTADESSQITQDHFGDLRVDDLAVLRPLKGPRDSGILQLRPLGIGERCGQARRDREDNAPVIALAGDETRLVSFNELLEPDAGKQALPLDHSLFRIEVAEGERLECASRPGLKNPSR